MLGRACIQSGSSGAPRTNIGSMGTDLAEMKDGLIMVKATSLDLTAVYQDLERKETIPLEGCEVNIGNSPPPAASPAPRR